jgi:hypothetical protein
MLPCQVRKVRRNPEEKIKAAPRKTVHRYPRDLTRNWTAQIARRLNLRGVSVMMDKSNKPYAGMKPVYDHDDSEFRDNRGPREPFVNDRDQDDDYFPVPEVLDEP